MRRRSSRKPRTSRVTGNNPRSGDERFEVLWQYEDDRWYAPHGDNPLVARAVQLGLDESAAKQTPGRDLMRAFGMKHRPRAIINEERLLLMVPGNLAHRSTETIVRHYLDLGRRGLPDYYVREAIESALESLGRRKIIQGGQGERGEGWTRADAAYKRRQEERRAEREIAQKEQEYEERIQESVAQFVAQFGAEPSAYAGDYSYKDVAKILAGLGVKL